MKPQNLPEVIVWYYIISSYPIYFLGAQSVLTPILGITLVAYLLIKWWNQDPTSNNKIHISLTCWVWIISLLVIALTTIVGGIDFQYGITRIAKSLLNQGWLRTWGVIGLFIVAGNLKIRTQLVSRALSIFCVQSLVIIPIIYCVIQFIDIPNPLYTSPFQIFQGSPDSYAVRLSYGADSFLPGFKRLVLLAPWPTPFGLVANIYFFIIKQESNQKLRFCGMIATVMMIVLSGSRLALLCLIFTLFLVWFLTNFARPWLHVGIGISCYLVGIWPNVLLSFFGSFKSWFDELRAGAGDSTNARSIMVRVGIERWQNEAFFWGHTPMAQDNIPKPLVPTPIGSHHTWVGLLFDHGLIGCLAFAIAMGWSFIDLLIKAQTSESAKMGLGILIILTIFTFGEPIPTYSYLLWPGFLFLGILFKETKQYSELIT